MWVLMNIKIKNAISIEKSVLQITGKDKCDFLQPLITNDVNKLHNHPIYSLILTPKGRFIADFFLLYDQENDCILFETNSKYKEILLEKFAEYKLHSKVKFKDVSDEYQCLVSFDQISTGFPDPRSDQLGYKLIVPKIEIADIENNSELQQKYEQKCLENLILDSEKFMNERSIPLAFRMEEQNAIDFKKGCFLGQETTAIMKNRGTLNKKIFFLVSEKNLSETNQEVIFNGEKIGILLKKISNNKGIMMLELHHIDKLSIKNKTVILP